MDRYKYADEIGSVWQTIWRGWGAREHSVRRTHKEGRERGGMGKEETGIEWNDKRIQTNFHG